MTDERRDGLEQPLNEAPPLSDINDAFHATYDEARANAEHTAPVFVLLADFLIVFHDGRRRESRIVPPHFHAIKAAAHAPVAVFAALFDGVDRPLGMRARRTLNVIRDAVQRPIAAFERLSDDMVADIEDALRTSVAFVERALAEDTASRAMLDAFAADAAPILRRLTAHASQVELASLHAAVEAELALLGADERRTLQVVVAGDHQARVRSLGMQYFEKRFGEPPGAETRVTYAEGLTDPLEALALVGKRRLDRAIASAFFGDAKRLQRDVLGDAAATVLGNAEIEPIS